jgi:hypothetical protein
MYRVHKGKIYGVLNDFDLSYQMTDEHPIPDQASSKQRTGTLPFMAIDLLGKDPPLHGYRHDLESFMWVILFHIGQYQDGNSVGHSGPYYNWLLGDRPIILLEKLRIRDGRTVPEAQPAFRPLLPWIRQMARMFRKASFVASMQESDVELDESDELDLESASGKFDLESAGGRITFKKFQKILDKGIFSDSPNLGPRHTGLSTQIKI